MPGVAALASGELMDVRTEAAQAGAEELRIIKFVGGEDCPIARGYKR